MAKERKQDLGTPEEDALEQHVREMMDITVPDPPAEPAPQPKKPVSIKIVDHTETPPTDDAKPNELSEAIAATNAQLTEQSATAPLLPSKKAATKVTVKHIEESPEAEATPAASEPEPTAEPEEHEQVVEAPPQTVDPLPEAEKPQTIQDAIDAAEVSDDESPLETEIESEATSKAVSDIIAAEGDELLAVHDAGLKDASPAVKKHRIRAFFGAWLHSSAARWATFLVLFAALVAVGAVPQSRYYILNGFGVRSSASVVVTDASTLRPLKNVKVTLDGKTVQTDKEGKANLDQLKLGPSELVVGKRAFKEEHRSITIGWGSNPLGDIALTPQGQQYTFVITDVFSGKPITDAEITAGESSATSNEQGTIKLTVDQTDADTLDLIIKAEGYRDEKLTLDLSSKDETPVAMTPAKKVAFVSKRSGTYDIYTIDADGKNEKLILAGTGNESSDLSFTQNQAADRAILVSTRDGKYAKDGSALNSLLLIDLHDGTTKTVTEAPQIRLIDWVGTRMIYVQLSADTAADDPSRYKLMSYDYVSGDNRQIAATNYFNDVLVVRSRVYYAPASAYQNGVNIGVFVVDADGNNKKPIFDQESWNMYRNSYDHILLAVQQDWYDYATDGDKPQKLDGQSNNLTNRVYADSPDGKQSVWVDSRDGKGTLVVYNTNDKQETVLYAQNGVKGPVRWLNNTTLVYRLANSSETSDYVISTLGGDPKKVASVTDTTSLEHWSY